MSPTNEADARVRIPFKAGHYQFTFYPNKGKVGLIRRVYTGKNIYQVHDDAKADALKDYPEAHAFCCHSPQCD